jgi:succinate dehydrogenase flavin-adding protein (antitoxin of CptAB toxin-antitoxin module)
MMIFFEEEDRRRIRSRRIRSNLEGLASYTDEELYNMINGHKLSMPEILVQLIRKVEEQHK